MRASVKQLSARHRTSDIISAYYEDLPGVNSAGFNATTVYDLAHEVCMTINDHRGFSEADQNTKSSRFLVPLLVPEECRDTIDTAVVLS